MKSMKKSVLALVLAVAVGVTFCPMQSFAAVEDDITTLQGQVATLQSQVEQLQADLATEVSAREAADAELLEAINAEASARKAADAAVTALSVGSDAAIAALTTLKQVAQDAQAAELAASVKNLEQKAAREAAAEKFKALAAFAVDALATLNPGTKWARTYNYNKYHTSLGTALSSLVDDVKDKLGTVASITADGFISVAGVATTAAIVSMTSSKDNALSKYITAEKKIRIAADVVGLLADVVEEAQIMGLQAQVNALNVKIDNVRAELLAAIAQEKAEREAAIADLQAQLDAEVAAREAAVKDLQAQLDAEKAARIAADKELKKEIALVKAPPKAKIISAKKGTKKGTIVVTLKKVARATKYVVVYNYNGYEYSKVTKTTKVTLTNVPSGVKVKVYARAMNKYGIKGLRSDFKTCYAK